MYDGYLTELRSLISDKKGMPRTSTQAMKIVPQYNDMIC